jgi:photosystem II stability/assembly factor-like uncharacterized protein
MKIKLLTLAALLLLVTPAFADYAWHVIVNDAGQPAFYNIAGTSDTVLHACGTEGVVSKSTDRGVNWTSSVVGSSQYTWYSINFPTATTGYVAGTRRDQTKAEVYKTTDSGATWILKLETGESSIFFASYFATENIGWAVGRPGVTVNTTVWRTTNGGDNWTMVSLPWGANTFGLHAVHDGLNYNVWVVGNTGRIARSKSSGESFINLTDLVGITSQTLVGVFFIDKDTGWLVGANGTILKTANGTNDTPTWTAQTSGTTQQLNRVYFADANNGWVIGNNGTILTTTNGGNTWTSVSTTPVTTANLGGIYYYDSNDIWVVGEGSRVEVKFGGVFLTSLSQASLRRGESASITATGSNNNAGATVAFSGSGITVSNIQVVSSTQITFTAAVDAQAATGSRDISIYNADGTTTTFSGYFAVTPDTGNIPIDTVVPGDGYQNTTLKIMIGGSGFNSTAHVIVSGSGVNATVDTAKLTSTSIPVTLVIDANATVGARDVMVTQGNDIGYKANAFEVKAAASTGQTIKNVVFGPNPLTRNAGNVINVQFEDTSTGVIEMPIFDMTGRPIAKLSHNTTSPGLQKHAINVITDPIVPGGLANGPYKILFVRGGIQNSGKIFLAR